MSNWIVYALISMVFAGLTSVIAKYGLKNVSGDAGLAIRTSMVFFLVWLNAFAFKHTKYFPNLSKNDIIFLCVSGLTTTLSWIFMIKVTVLYPNGEGKSVDMDYYLNKHIPLVETLSGDSLRMTAVEKVLPSGTPDTPVPYLAIGHLYFETMTSFQSALKLHGEEMSRDRPIYTNIEPVILVCEVMK